MFFEKQTVFACSFLDILPQKGEKVKTGRPEFGRKAAAKTNKAKRSEKTERKVSPAFGAKLRLNAKKANIQCGSKSAKLSTAPRVFEAFEPFAAAEVLFFERRTSFPVMEKNSP